MTDAIANSPETAAGGPALLLIEDDLDTAELIRETLEDHFGPGAVTHVPSLSDARGLDLYAIDLVVSDMNLPDGSGLDLLPEMLEVRPDLPVVYVTAEGILENAIQAVQEGAYDYVVKAGDYLFALPVIVEKNLALWRVKRQNEQLLEEVNRKNAQLEVLVTQLEEMASTDPLTGLANRRSFGESLKRRFAEAQRQEHDLSLLLMDLDGFKQLNDTLGHQRGDTILQLAAKILRANCRVSDVAGRLGGDEFVLLLSHADGDEALSIAHRVSEQFTAAAKADLTPSGFKRDVSMSIGVATLCQGKAPHDEALLAQADHAMYAAKARPEMPVCVYGLTDRSVTAA